MEHHHKFTYPAFTTPPMLYKLNCSSGVLGFKFFVRKLGNRVFSFRESWKENCFWAWDSPIFSVIPWIEDISSGNPRYDDFYSDNPRNVLLSVKFQLYPSLSGISGLKKIYSDNGEQFGRESGLGTPSFPFPFKTSKSRNN